MVLAAGCFGHYQKTTRWNGFAVYFAEPVGPLFKTHDCLVYAVQMRFQRVLKRNTNVMHGNFLGTIVPLVSEVLVGSFPIALNLLVPLRYARKLAFKLRLFGKQLRFNFFALF